MISEYDRNVVTLVTALDEAGMFVVFATRMHRVKQGSSSRRRECLCHVFHAAGLCGSQELFVELQDVLASPGVGGFVPAERGTRVVNRHELLLLGALAHWQRHPGDLSDHVLEWLAATIRRVAAPLAREFAQRMAQAGLLLEARLPQVGTLTHAALQASVPARTH
jgi:hypothetical protein